MRYYDLSIRGQGGPYDREIIQNGVPTAVVARTIRSIYPNTLGDLTNARTATVISPMPGLTTCGSGAVGRPLRLQPPERRRYHPAILSELPPWACPSWRSASTTAPVTSANWPFPLYRNASPMPVWSAANQIIPININNKGNPGQVLIGERAPAARTMQTRSQRVTFPSIRRHSILGITIVSQSTASVLIITIAVDTTM